MEISAPEGSAADERTRAVAYYRGILLQLQAGLMQFMALPARGAETEAAGKALDLRSRLLRLVIDIEANLEKQAALVDGGAVELDFTAARAEILERLAVRSTEG